MNAKGNLQSYLQEHRRQNRRKKGAEKAKSKPRKQDNPLPATQRYQSLDLRRVLTPCNSQQTQFHNDQLLQNNPVDEVSLFTPPIAKAPKGSKRGGLHLNVSCTTASARADYSQSAVLESGCSESVPSSHPQYLCSAPKEAAGGCESDHNGSITGHAEAQHGSEEPRDGHDSLTSDKYQVLHRPSSTEPALIGVVGLATSQGTVSGIPSSKVGRGGARQSPETTPSITSLHKGDLSRAKQIQEKVATVPDRSNIAEFRDSQIRCRQSSPGRTPSPQIHPAHTRFCESPEEQHRQGLERDSKKAQTSPLEELTWSLISAFDKASIKDSPVSTEDSPYQGEISRRISGSGVRIYEMDAPWTREKRLTTQDVAALMESSPSTPAFFNQDCQGSPMSISPAEAAQRPQSGPSGLGKSRLGTVEPVINARLAFDSPVTGQQNFVSDSPGSPQARKAETSARKTGFSFGDAVHQATTRKSGDRQNNLPVRKIISKSAHTPVVSQATRHFLQSEAAFIGSGNWLVASENDRQDSRTLSGFNANPSKKPVDKSLTKLTGQEKAQMRSDPIQLQPDHAFKRSEPFSNDGFAPEATQQQSEGPAVSRANHHGGTNEGRQMGSSWVDGNRTKPVQSKGLSPAFVPAGRKVADKRNLQAARYAEEFKARWAEASERPLVSSQNNSWMHRPHSSTANQSNRQSDAENAQQPESGMTINRSADLKDQQDHELQVETSSEALRTRVQNPANKYLQARSSPKDWFGQSQREDSRRHQAMSMVQHAAANGKDSSMDCEAAVVHQPKTCQAICPHPMQNMHVDANQPEDRSRHPHSAAARFVPPREATIQGRPGSGGGLEAAKYYRPFKKQQDALKFAAEANQEIALRSEDAYIAAPHEVKCWVEEVSGRDCYYRSFLAASPVSFWNKYQQLAAHSRHCYEVIEQGKPCHLYFDLEYDTACNQDVDGNAMVDKVIEMTIRAIRHYWDLDIRMEDVVELDSSSDVKFSRHVLVKLQGHAFENNLAAGSFVNRLLGLPEAAELTVRKQSASEELPAFTSMVDPAVYSRNRHFRLIWSSKGGKRAILKTTNRLSSQEDMGHPQTLQDQFMNSLVTLVEPDSKLLTLDVSKLNARGLIKEAGGARNSNTSCTTTAPSDILNMRKMDDDDRNGPTGLDSADIQRWAEAAKPFIEEAATNLAGGSRAYVRSIIQCGAAGSVAFGMLGPGSHYCENVGRFHKSNHSYFIANFLEGVYAQKCYDPDCSRYRSEWMPLPEEFCPLALQYDDT